MLFFSVIIIIIKFFFLHSVFVVEITLIKWKQTNGDVIQNTQIIANTFNSYYLSVAEHITKEINTSNSVGGNQNPVTYLQNMLHQSFLLCEFKHVSPKEIENVAKSLKAKNSHGYDEIPTKVIKQNISYISSPLAHICNLMLSSGTVHSPLDWNLQK